MSIHGPLRHVLTGGEQGLAAGLSDLIAADKAANADLVLRRLWVEGDAAGLDHLRAVADACKHVRQELLDAVHQRRAAALTGLAAAAREPGVVARAVVITPGWRVVVGHGEDSAIESSLTLSPTYGVPTFPATALKGLTAAYARHTRVARNRIAAVFGSPRPGEDPDDARCGSVAFFCALPVTPPTVVVDVLTPHVKPYYDQANTLGAEAKPGENTITDEKLTEPPAEYHNPVPVRFLAVAGGQFRAWLLGPVDDVELASELLCQSLDDEGIGGKTAAGYGYCTATIEETLP